MHALFRSLTAQIACTASRSSSTWAGCGARCRTRRPSDHARRRGQVAVRARLEAPRAHCPSTRRYRAPPRHGDVTSRSASSALALDGRRRHLPEQACDALYKDGQRHGNPQHNLHTYTHPTRTTTFTNSTRCPPTTTTSPSTCLHVSSGGARHADALPAARPPASTTRRRATSSR